MATATAVPGAAAEDPLPGGERKQVTILFCDIVGSTPLTDKLGAEGMLRLLNEFLPTALARASAFEGNLNQFLGDGFMLLFGAPIAREDHARRAALAALAIRDSVASHRWISLPAGERIEIRIGLNSGAVVFGTVGDGAGAKVTAIGDAANVAARLQAAADPGQVVCSEPVARAVASQVLCRPLGARLLKGKAQPVEVFEVVARRAAMPAIEAGAAASALAGREVERAGLDAAVKALAGGRGGFAGLIGEAGLGKTRLIAGATAAAAAAGVRVLKGTCVSYGRSISYGPFREVIRDALGLREDDDETALRHKLREGLVALFGDEARDMLPFMTLLLGLAPAPPDAARLEALDGLATGHRIFLTSLRVMEAMARREPVLIALDDWQWADQSSADLLRHLSVLADRVPVMFLVGARPDAEGAAAGVDDLLAAAPEPMAGQRCRIVLRGLDDAASRDLLRALLGGGRVNSALEARLLRRAAGNPFYLEQLVQTLVATRALERDGAGGEWRSSGAGDLGALPDGIEGVIMARVDRLDAGPKQLLKIAAVIGRRVRLDVLAAVAADHAGLPADIARLKEAQLLADGAPAPEPELVFKHPLIQQAVYDSLLEEQRARLHHTVGCVIEGLFAARLHEVYPLLAHHFAQAQDKARARDYLVRAGAQAGSIAADAEALEHFESALRLSRDAALELDALERARLAAPMAEALYRLGRHDAALEHALGALAGLGFRYPVKAGATRRAVAAKLLRRSIWRMARPLRAAGLGGRVAADPAYLAASQLFEVVGAIDYFLDPPRFVLGILTMLAEAERRPLSRALAISSSSLGLVCDTLGLYRFGALLHARALRAAARLDDTLALGYANHLFGLHQYTTGQWTGALATLAEGAAQLASAGHLRFQASCIGAQYFVLRSMGDPRWIDLARLQLDVAEAGRDDHAIAWGINAAGVAHLYRGEHEAALVMFEKASLAYEAIPDYRYLSAALARRSLCHALAGGFDVALALLERSEALVRRFRITGISASPPLLVGAEALLCITAGLRGDARFAETCRRAGVACRHALRHGRTVGDESAAEALRLSGLHAWLAGDRMRAQRRWQAAIETAKSLGANQVLARTHDLIAVLTGDAAHAARARELFAVTGAGPLPVTALAAGSVQG